MLILDQPCTHQEFADAVGVSRRRITAMVTAGILPSDSTPGQWVTAYCEWLGSQAPQRGDALPRRQRIAQERRTRAALQTSATTVLLSWVLEAVSAAVDEAMSTLPDRMRGALPDVSPGAHAALAGLIDEARAAWRRSTDADALAQAVRSADPLADELSADPGEAPPADDGEGLKP